MNTMKKIAMVGLAGLGLGLIASSGAMAQSSGVSDDRVSLPEGPGSLEGVGENIETDPNMGVMRYGVSISTPGGFPGVSPSLRLSYSSGNGGSVVGMGWTMDTPFIERMTYRGLPEYTLADDFSASGGDQLVALPETTPPTYRSRFEKGFVRYRWHDAGDGDQGYWTAEYPDGRIGYFGANSDGTLVPDARVGYEGGTFRYMLVEMVDVYDHKIRYTYEKFGNVALLRNVGYVFKEDGTARYSVSLQYEPREDETGFDYLSDAKGGFDELLTQRLAAINVFSGPERIRRYELTYESYDTSGGFTRLTNVQMIGLEDGLFPSSFSFEYSRALGGLCGEAVCDQPFVVEMGNIGVDVGVGRATLLDINGDALPDLVNTSDNGPHAFLLNIPTEDGQSSFADTPILSAVPEATGSSLRLGTPFAQVLDVNGDGFTDMINAQTGRMLINRGNGDWEMSMGASNTEQVAGLLGNDGGELRTLRFLDYDNDKRIDLMRSTRTETNMYRNMGMNGFEEDERIDLLGYGLQADRIDFSDMNGDGLLDPVRISAGGLRYKLNLGWGHWGDEVEIVGLPIEESELELASLEDLNGDGLSDLVVVVGSTVKYAINRNGSQFSNITTLNVVPGEGGDVGKLRA
ncbi:MAG: SpvB/TcaC N-terminal domain-containing protein, partial [Myxococcota bacterium]